ncbi:MAG: hypothetical protein L6R45_18250 [Anaerolineae bacterium]|nr:hypothetical protein [Anaerolineae bacterium]
MGVWRGSQPALKLEFDYTIQAFGLIIAVPPRKWYNRLEFRFRPGTFGGFGFLTINNLPGKPKFNSWLRYHLLLLLAYFLLAAVLTWPTLPHLTTHLPGDGGDDPAIAWNFWWLKYALLNLRQNPFQSNFLFYPIGINLAFYTLTVLNAVTALPLTLNFGVVAASNLHLLFTFVSGGYGAFLLARHVLTTVGPLKSRGAGERGSGGDISPLPPCPPAPLLFFSAALAGGFYAFASSKLFYVALGQFNIASSHWIPWTVLYLLRMQRNPHRLKNAVMAGLFFTLQAWTELTYASFLAVFMALYWIYDLQFTIYDLRFKAITNDISSNKSPLAAIYYQLSTILILLLIVILGLSPILAHMLPDMQAEGDFLVEGSGFAQDFSADVLGFVIPTLHHPLLGKLIGQTNIQNFTLGQHIYPGFVLLGLFLLALLTGYRRPELRFWLMAAVVFGLLCLGPMIMVDGYVTGLPGPFSLLQQLPFFKGNRYPSRYSVMLLLSLSIIAAFALAQIGQWASRHWSTTKNPSSIYYPLFTLIFSLFLFEHLSIPLPQSDMRVPTAYQIIAAEPSDFAVLDIPFAWRNGFRITGALTTQFMFGQFYQTAHQKRLLQGNTSRNPAFKFQYFTAAPVINSLLALETGHPLPSEQWEADRAIAAEVLAFFNINYIVVRPYQYDKFDEEQNITVTEQAVIPYIENMLPVEKIHDEAAIKIYRVTPTEESRLQSGLQIDSAAPLAPLYFGEGWGWLPPGQPVAAQRQAVRLLLPLTGDSQRVTLRLRLPELAGTFTQSLSLELNGWQSPSQVVSADWQDLTFELPAGVAKPGLNTLWLRFTRVAPTPLPDQTEDWPPEITVLSAGEEVGDFGHIFINGRDVSPNQRGYNVAIIPPNAPIQTANFDTHLDPAASAALARLLASSPPASLIALAAADEASANLSEEAVRALQALGAVGDLRGCFRCSHAFIRTSSGQTFEALDALRPVGVTIGLGLTEPQVAAEVEWIRVEAVER